MTKKSFIYTSEVFVIWLHITDNALTALIMSKQESYPLTQGEWFMAYAAPSNQGVTF